MGKTSDSCQNEPAQDKTGAAARLRASPLSPNTTDSSFLFSGSQSPYCYLRCLNSRAAFVCHHKLDPAGSLTHTMPPPPPPPAGYGVLSPLLWLFAPRTSFFLFTRSAGCCASFHCWLNLISPHQEKSIFISNFAPPASSLTRGESLIWWYCFLCLLLTLECICALVWSIIFMWRCLPGSRCVCHSSQIPT